MNGANDNDDVNELPSLPAIRRAFAAQVRAASPTPQCLDDEIIAALAEGALGGESHTSAVKHLASCGVCRSAVASVARALADPQVAQELKPGRASRRRLYRIAAVALPAAAVLALLLVRPQPPEPASFTHRAPTITAVPAPIPTSPVGVVPEARMLRWAAVPSADRYRVTLFDAGARVLYETEVPGMSVSLPPSVTLIPGQRYLWRVEARTGFDRWSPSDLVEFTIARGPPQ